MLNSKLNFY